MGGIRRRRSSRTALVLAVPLVLGLVGGLTSAGLAADEPIPSELLIAKEDVAALADYWQVGTGEAERRIAVGETVGGLQAELDRHEDQYSGLWIDHEVGSTSVTIRVPPGDADFVRELVEKHGLDALVTIDATAVHSIAELQRTAKELRLRMSGRPDTEVDSTFDLKAGTVVVIAPNAATKDAVESVQLDLAEERGYAPVEVVLGSLATPTGSVWGGLKGSTCTHGFTVKNSSGDYGLLTAGHCSNSQKVYRSDGTSIWTTYQSGSTEGSNDQQWATTSDTEFGRFNTDFNYSSFRTVSGTKGRGSQAIGDSACKFGKNIGYKCGTITDRNYAPSWIYNVNNSFMRLDTGANVGCDGGDSGGPVFNGYTAYGIVSGAVGPSGDWDCIYMAINYTSNLGLSVYVP